MTFDPRAVVHAYELIADGYAGRFGGDLAVGTMDRAVLDAALGSRGPSGRVLDLGCGPAPVASYVMGRTRGAVGVDLTPAMLAVARRCSSRIPLVNGDVLSLPLRDGAADGAIAWFSLHNLPRSLLGQAVGEVRRALRPEGVFVIATHAGRGHDVVEHVWRGTTEDVIITYYDADQLRAALGRHRFEVLDVQSREPRAHEHAATKLFVTARAG
jgi:ubiquinone/menaquinone biosynthesis C-methylase UbiE